MMLELFSTLALAVKQLRQKRSSGSVLADTDVSYLTQWNAVKRAKRCFVGAKDVEVVLQRLDRLTQDEALATAMPTLEVIYCLIRNMRVVADGEQMRLTNYPPSAESSRRRGIC